MIDVRLLRRQGWTPALAERAFLRMAERARRHEAENHDDDDALVNELLLCLDVEAIDAPESMEELDGLPYLLANFANQVELPLVPPELQRVADALTAASDSDADRLELLKGLGGDPVRHLDALLNVMTEDDRDGRSLPDVFGRAIQVLCAMRSAPANRCLLRQFGESTDSELAATIRSHIETLGAGLVEPTLAEWSRMSRAARVEVAVALDDANTRDPRVLDLFHAWVDEAPGLAAMAFAWLGGSDAVAPLTRKLAEVLAAREDLDGAWSLEHALFELDATPTGHQQALLEAWRAA